jgi:hypothetical protein
MIKEYLFRTPFVQQDSGGWAVPNYYVYFKTTIRDGLAVPCATQERKAL